MTPDWLQKAACRNADPDLFFPERGDQAHEARAICASCPVIDDCRHYALTTSQRHGIWAGMAYDELKRVRTTRIVQCRTCLKRFWVRADRKPPPIFCSPECRSEARRKVQQRSHSRTG